MADSQNITLKCAQCGRFFATLTQFNIHECPNEEGDSSQIQDDSSSVSNSWTVQATKTLLTSYEKRKEKFNSPVIKKKTLWQEITSEVNREIAAKFTISQVEGRWKTVLAAYRKHKDDQKKTGQSRKTFEYLDIMNDILGDSHSTTPKFTTSNIKVSLEPEAGCSKALSSSESNEEGNQSKCNSSAQKKRKCGTGRETHVKRRKSVSGATQMISSLEKYTEKTTEWQEAAAKRAEARHTENIQILKNLVDVLKDMKKD